MMTPPNQLSFSMDWLSDITKQLSEKALSVSAWGFLAGILGKVHSMVVPMNVMVSSLADATLIVSFLVGLLTLGIKAKEFIKCYFPKRKTNRTKTRRKV